LDTQDLAVKLLTSYDLKEFCFDYVCNNPLSLNFKNLKTFDEKFSVSESLLADFLKHLNEKRGVNLSSTELLMYKNRIKNYIKAEITSYLFDVESINYINYPYDKDIVKAIEWLDID